MKEENQQEKEFKFRCYKFTLNAMKLIETMPNRKMYWLALIRDSKSGDVKLANELINESQELSNILAASVMTMKKNLKEGF